MCARACVCERSTCVLECDVRVKGMGCVGQDVGNICFELKTIILAWRVPWGLNMRAPSTVLLLVTESTDRRHRYYVLSLVENYSSDTKSPIYNYSSNKHNLIKHRNA